MLLLHLVRCLLIDVALCPCNRETLPDDHVRLGLCKQCVANILLAARSPTVVALEAQRPDGHVAIAAHVFSSDRCRLCGDAIDVHLELLAESLERQIVDVVTEGVLNFATDSGETEDDVRSEDGTGDGNPLKRGVKLERQNHNVDPGDLRDSDRVGDRERGVEHTIETDETFVESNDTSDCVTLANRNAERACDLDLLAWFW